MEDIVKIRKSIPSKYLSGTTTVGVTFKSGIVIASDKRASMGTFIASKAAKKTISITDKVVATISGLVADGQFLTDRLRAEVELENLESGGKLPVKAIAYYLSNIMYSLRPMIYISQLIVGGVDEKGGHIYSLDPYGNLTEEKYIATGSGSPLAISILDKEYRENLNENEAINLVIKAISSSISRDSATGDGLDVVVVDKSGQKWLRKEQVEELLKLTEKNLVSIST